MYGGGGEGIAAAERPVSRAHWFWRCRLVKHYANVRCLRMQRWHCHRSCNLSNYTHLPCQLSPMCLAARSRDVAAETISAALKPAHHDFPIVGDYTAPLEYSERRVGSVARDVHHHSKVKQTRAYMMDDCLHYMRQQGNHLGRVSDSRSQSWSQWLAARRRCGVAVVGEDVRPDSDQELNLQSLESVVEAAEDDNHTDSSWRWSLGLLVQNGRRCARTKARVQITPGAPRRSSAVASRIASSRHPWSVERGYR